MTADVAKPTAPAQLIMDSTLSDSQKAAFFESLLQGLEIRDASDCVQRVNAVMAYYADKPLSYASIDAAAAQVDKKFPDRMDLGITVPSELGGAMYETYGAVYRAAEKSVPSAGVEGIDVDAPLVGRQKEAFIQYAAAAWIPSRPLGDVGELAKGGNAMAKILEARGQAAAVEQKVRTAMHALTDFFRDKPVTLRNIVSAVEMLEEMPALELSNKYGIMDQLFGAYSQAAKRPASYVPGGYDACMVPAPGRL